ncbi:MAG: hypothetical protein AAGC57_15960 [Pseudomonadota bacterium]
MTLGERPIREGRGIDWLTASHEDRKQLFRVCRAIVDRTRTTWTTLFREALDAERDTADSALATFRNGRISRKDAADIEEWIITHHLDVAVGKAPSHFDPAAKANWAEFLDEHGQYGRIRVIVERRDRGLIQRAADAPVATDPIPLGTPFWFEIDSPRAGSIIALQGCRKLWYPFSLHSDGVSLSTECLEGTQIVPRDPDTDRPIALHEADDDGRHAYVFLIADEGVIDALCARLAAGAPATPGTLRSVAHELTAIGTSPSVLRANPVFST